MNGHKWTGINATLPVIAPDDGEGFRFAKSNALEGCRSFVEPGAHRIGWRQSRMMNGAHD
jgi:hypothetical protein